MKPKEYLEKHYETNIYLLAYVEKMIGEPMVDDDHFDIDDYNAKGNHVLDKLVEDHKNEIEKFFN